MVKKTDRGLRVISLRTAVLLWAATMGMMGTVVYLARADGVPTAPLGRLSFSGVLTGYQPPQEPMLRFEFKGDGGRTCTATGGAKLGGADAAGSHPFYVTLVLGDECSGFFNGGSVTYDILVEDKKVATGQPLSTVPYAKYAEVAGTAGTPECPLGYARNQADQGIVLCQRSAGTTVIDEVVRVGEGPATFWIDRYEASVWSSLEANATQYGAFDATVNFVPYPPSFLKNGQWAIRGASPPKPPVYALSRKDVLPSTQITWFQALAACAASGKELVGRREWFLASVGTPDSGATGIKDGKCVTNEGLAVRRTGLGGGCESAWGTQDMIGNVAEWTDEWHATVGEFGKEPKATWPDAEASFGNDASGNIPATSVVAYKPDASTAKSLPAAVSRGGWVQSLTGAGIFSMTVESSPALWFVGIGFRCVIRR